MTIIVVGAGIIGLSIAHELASRGADVRVLDPRGAGQGATRASAGILAPYIEGHAPDLLKLGVCSLSMYPEFVERVRDESGAPIEFAISGTLQVALDAGEREALHTAAVALRQAGVDHAIVDAAEAQTAEPHLSRTVQGALRIASHGYVNVRMLTLALEAAAQRYGVTSSDERVSSIRDDGTGVRIQTGDGETRADAVVVAAGSWTDQISIDGAAHAHASEPVVKPIRGQLVQLALDGRASSHVIWGSRCYLVPWSDGSVLVGATVEDVGFEESATAGGIQQLLQAAIRLMPALSAARFEGVRVGLRPMVSDDLPVVGRASAVPNVYYAAGHYRNGVLLAPWTSRMIADLVLENREHADLALVRPGRVGL